METNEEISIGEIIIQKLKEKGKNISWLSQKIKCDKSNLYKILNNKNYDYCKLLYTISKAMNEDFFSYFSDKLKEEK